MTTILAYESCTRCNLHRYRRNLVFGRGDIPADILIVGIAPGRSEDAIGKPFIGLSGKLLTTAMADANLLSAVYPSFYISNVLGCRPCDGKQEPNRDPTADEAWACWPRLEETWQNVEPKEIILLGKVTENYCRQYWPRAIPMMHPAGILRRGGVKSASYQKLVRDLAEVFRRV